MTSSLRRKRPTTARPTTAALILTSLLAGGAAAQTPPATLKLTPGAVDLAPATARPAPKTLYFQKDAVAIPAATATTRPPILLTRQDDAADKKDDSPLPESVTRAIERASLPGEAGLPTNEELFALRSEQQILQSVVDEARESNKKRTAKMQATVSTFMTLPSSLSPADGGYTPLSKEPFPGRHWETYVKRVEPNFIAHHRLYFEELNSERYGWDLGPIQPFVSTGYYIKDFLLLPYHFGTRPFQRYEVSAGYCLPGDPVPYMLYPFEASLTGAMLEAGVVVGAYAVLP